MHSQYFFIGDPIWQCSCSFIETQHSESKIWNEIHHLLGRMQYLEKLGPYSIFANVSMDI